MHNVKHTNQALQERAFTYHVIDYDNHKREYILQNLITKEIKRIPKEDYDKLLKEQHGN